MDKNLIALVIMLALLAAFVISDQLGLFGRLTITGAVTGTASVTVSTSTTISMPIDTVAFGSLAPLAQNNTSADLAIGGLRPFVIQNDGNVDVNLTLSATNLWTTEANPKLNYFSYNITWNESGSTGSAAMGNVNNASFLNVNTSSTGNWRAVPSSTAEWLANCTDFRAANDALNVHTNVTVPSEEPAASRSSTLTILASQAGSGADC